MARVKHQKRNFQIEAFTAPGLAAAPLPAVPQEQKFWCWAACIQMILAPTRPMKQFEIVNAGLVRDDCQGLAATECNLPLVADDPSGGRSIRRTLERLGRPSQYQAFPIAVTQIAAALGQSPIIAAFAASGSNGHVVVLSDLMATADSENPRLWVTDPAKDPPEAGWKTYDEVLEGLHLGLGFWSGSLFNIGG